MSSNQRAGPGAERERSAVFAARYSLKGSTARAPGGRSGYTGTVSEPPFPGFYAPEYTQVPNNLFDDLMPRLSGAELKVLLYVMRQTFGWHRDAAAISLTALQNGTGLTRKTLAVAVRSLEALGCMIASRSVGDDGVAAVTVYRLNVIERGGSVITPPRQRNNSPGGSVTTPHLPIEKRNPVKENVRTGSEQQDPAALWQETLTWLQNAMNARNYRLTFEHSEAVGFDGDVLRVQVKDQHALKEIQTRYGPLVGQVLGEQKVRFEVG